MAVLRLVGGGFAAPWLQRKIDRRHVLGPAAGANAVFLEAGGFERAQIARLDLVEGAKLAVKIEPLHFVASLKREGVLLLPEAQLVALREIGLIATRGMTV